MNLLERVYKVAYLVEQAGGEIHTRKKLHKLVYLFQQSGENFDQSYQYLHYGVFSPTLASDVDLARSFKLIAEEGDENSGFILTLNRESWESQNQSMEFTSTKTTSLLEALKDEEPQLLEVLSTVVYLSKNGYTKNDLRSKLVELKPKLKGYYSKAYRFAREYCEVDV